MTTTKTRDRGFTWMTTCVSTAGVLGATFDTRLSGIPALTGRASRGAERARRWGITLGALAADAVSARV